MGSFTVMKNWILQSAAVKVLWLIMFWNVENFFSPVADGTGDGEYTPTGYRHWNWSKFNRKRDDIAKIILLAKERYGECPMLVGLCEVENRRVVNELVYNTILSRLEYGAVHRESPDSRGIDVALLYLRERFRVVKAEFLAVPAPGGGVLDTREILYVKGVADGIDTIHCLVNHWPSRLGGKRRSSLKRRAAMERLKVKCDSILTADSLANIVVMGDFNAPADSPLLSELGMLVNMAPEVRSPGRGVRGTYKYKGEWESIDHFLLSKNLYCGRWFNAVGGAEIFAPDYLLEEDPVYLGCKVRRTLTGPVYNGGVSDHLPIILRIFQEEY